jgi:hypothetical protein
LKNIHKKNKYYLLVHVDEWDAKNENDGCFRLINRFSGEKEYASSVYPAVLEAMCKYTEAIDRFEKILRDQNPQTLCKVTQISEHGDNKVIWGNECYQGLKGGDNDKGVD